MSNPAAGAAFEILGGAFKSITKIGAQRDLDKANKIKVRGITARNLRSRRDFIRQSRLMLAQNLATTAGREGAIDSSAFQGTQASIITQTAEGIKFDKEEARRDRKIRFLQGQAQHKIQQGERFGAFTDIVAGAANI